MTHTATAAPLFEATKYELLLGDCIATMKTLPANSVQCVVTSPPYLNLRSYLPDGHPDKHLEIGGEQSVAEYVGRLVEVFREVRRVLRDDGLLFLNLGDSYNGSGGAGGDYGPGGLKEGQPKYAGSRMAGLKPKDLIGVPWECAFALRADGWWLRSAITWCKGNPMPESVLDRPTSATEMVFMLSKSQNYFYDSVAAAEPASQPLGIPKRTGQHKATELGEYRGMYADTPSSGLGTNQGAATRNRRNWWVINSEPFPGSHFAVMPQKLVEPCILAGTSAHGCCSECGAPWERVVEREVINAPYQELEGRRQREKSFGAQNGGINNVTLKADIKRTTTGWQPTCLCGTTDVVPCTVLDPFAGAGTSLLVAIRHGRNAIGCELNESYINLSIERLQQCQPMLGGMFT